MTHNDVLRRLRYMLALDDDTMIAVFAAADHAVTKDQIKSWRAVEDAPHYQPLATRTWPCPQRSDQREARQAPRPQPNPSGTSTITSSPRS